MKRKEEKRKRTSISLLSSSRSWWCNSWRNSNHTILKEFFIDIFPVCLLCAYWILIKASIMNFCRRESRTINASTQWFRTEEKRKIHVEQVPSFVAGWFFFVNDFFLLYVYVTEIWSTILEETLSINDSRFVYTQNAMKECLGLGTMLYAYHWYVRCLVNKLIIASHWLFFLYLSAFLLSSVQKS